MRMQLTETQKMYIRRETRFRLLRENLLNEEASIFDNFMSSVSSKLAGMVTDESGEKNMAGKMLDKLLPDTFVTTLKKKLLQSLAKSMGIDDNTPLIEFIENILANIELSEISAIISGKIKCDQIGDILLRGATQSLTKLGLKKMTVPIIHFFAENQFDSGSPNFIKKTNKMKAVSEKDVTAMLDSMIGVLGETLISKIVYAFIKEHAVEFMKNHICKAIGASTTDTIDPEVIPAPKSPTAPNPDPTIIDVDDVTPTDSPTDPPRISGPTRGLPGPTPDDMSEISINEMRRLEYYYRSIL